MALSQNSKILVSDITAIQTTANSALSTANTANSALSSKYDKTGGTISGSISATGNITASGNIKGARLSANNGTNNNIDFMHDSKSTGGYYLNFDKISNGNWLEIATTGSGGSLKQFANNYVSGKVIAGGDGYEYTSTYTVPHNFIGIMKIYCNYNADTSRGTTWFNLNGTQIAAWSIANPGEGGSIDYGVVYLSAGTVLQSYRWSHPNHYDNYGWYLYGQFLV